MRYVQQFGAVWRVSEKNFKRLKQKVERGEEYNLDELGTMITTNLYNVLDEVEKLKAVEDNTDFSAFGDAF